MGTIRKWNGQLHYYDEPGPGESQRPRNVAAETELAQLFKNAHDAGDTDAMRSLGRELQRRGWEYGETVPEWPYIKPPVGFQADPNIDATASLRAAAPRSSSTLAGLQTVAAANPVVQAAADIPHNAAAFLKTLGATVAGIPDTVADILLTPTEQATKVIGGFSGPKYYPGYYFWQLPAATAREGIEENPASQWIHTTGQQLQETASHEMAKAKPGLVSDAERALFGAAPVALLPGGIPAISAQTYIQRRGEGATPAQAGLGAGTTAAGLKLGGQIASRLGDSFLGTYLNQVVGYTVGPQAVDEIHRAIETGELPDPLKVGERTFINALSATGFAAIHGGERSSIQPDSVAETPRLIRGSSAPPAREITRVQTPAPASDQNAPDGILKQIQRIVNGAPEPAETNRENQIRPDVGLSYTGNEPLPSYEEVAAKRLRQPGRTEGMFEAMGRYSRPETILEKIRRRVLADESPRVPQRSPVGPGRQRDASTAGLHGSPARRTTEGLAGPAAKESPASSPTAQALQIVGQSRPGPRSGVLSIDTRADPARRAPEWSSIGRSTTGRLETDSAAREFRASQPAGEFGASSQAADRVESQEVSVPPANEIFKQAQGPDGSLELSLSGMRKLIVPEHRMADEGHSATDTAQAMLDRAYDAAITSGSYKGVDLFVGGTGSGKSVTSEATPLSADRRANAIILESHAENADNLVQKIDKALEAALPIDLHVVVRDPVEAYKSVVERYNRAEANKPGSGKVVPVNYGAATHEAVIENVPKLMDRYAGDPGVRWHFIDNTGIPEAAREVGADDGLRLLGSVDTGDLRSKFNEVLDNSKLTKRDLERFRDQSLPSEFRSGPTEDSGTGSAPAKAAGYGDQNVVFTKESLARAQEAVRRKLNPNRLNADIDPTVLPHLLTIAGYHLEAGSIKFADWSSRMIHDVGDWIVPHLDQLYIRSLEYVYWRSKRIGLPPDEQAFLRETSGESIEWSQHPQVGSGQEQVLRRDVAGSRSEGTASGEPTPKRNIMVVDESSNQSISELASMYKRRLAEEANARTVVRGDASYKVDESGRTLLARVLITGPHRGRPKGYRPEPSGGRIPGEHRGHLAPEGGADNPTDVNVKENIISEARGSNLGPKKRFDLLASRVAQRNVGAVVETLHLPGRWPGDTRPRMVTHAIFVNGRLVHTITIPNE